LARAKTQRRKDGEKGFLNWDGQDDFGVGYTVVAAVAVTSFVPHTFCEYLALWAENE